MPCCGCDRKTGDMLRCHPPAERTGCRLRNAIGDNDAGETMPWQPARLVT